MLRYYILAYFKTDFTDEKVDFRINIPMDRGDIFTTFVHTAALLDLSNHAFTFVKFYAVMGKETIDMTEKVIEYEKELIGRGLND